MPRRLNLQHLLPLNLGDLATTAASRAAMGGEGRHRSDFERVTLAQRWGNWGDMTPAEVADMDARLAAGKLVMGCHAVTAGTVLVVTYADRKNTVVITPDEL